MLAAHLALPIVPILLLPFALVFFVVVMPLWFVGLGVTGLLFGFAWAIERLLGLVKVRFAISKPFHMAFRWVLTFGGLTERMKR